jgi:DNA-binding Xre family transcriptional regulator
MIRNERQYRITRAQAEKFRASIVAAEPQPPPRNVHPRLHKASIDAMRSQLETLEGELGAYEQLKTSKGKRRLTGELRDLGALLIQARIARGWSQRELAFRLGLQMQKVQQYEATEYGSASASRLLDVCQALGATVELKLELVDLPAREEFDGSESAVVGKRTRARGGVR